MSKTNEYTAIKSAGISIWKFLTPFILTAFIFGILLLTIINPIASHLLIKQQKVLNQIMSRHVYNSSAIFESGFWLIDKITNTNKSLLIHAKTVSLNKKKISLIDASLIEVDDKFHIIKTMESKELILKDQTWELRNVTEYTPKKQNTYHDHIVIPTNITRDKLESNFKRPDLVSIWSLPYFMNTLKETGHSSKIYAVYFYKLLIKPFLAVALLLISSSFTLAPLRSLKLSRTLGMCSLIGFVMYISVDIIYTIGGAIMSSTISTIILILIFLLISYMRVVRSNI